MAVTPKPVRAAVAICLALWAFAAAPVAAHSELVSSIPAAGATVASAPGMIVQLSFSETLKTGSKADIIGPDDRIVGTALIDPSDDTKLSWTSPTPLDPGAYTIHWVSIATDGDVLRNTIAFTVPVAASQAPTPTPSAAPLPEPASSTGTSAIIPVIAALVVIGLLAVVLLRNRRSAARR
jgi:copper resistance protein C